MSRRVVGYVVREGTVRGAGRYLAWAARADAGSSDWASRRSQAIVYAGNGEQEAGGAACRFRGRVVALVRGEQAPKDGPGSHRWDIRELNAQREEAKKLRARVEELERTLAGTYRDNAELDQLRADLAGEKKWSDGVLEQKRTEYLARIEAESLLAAEKQRHSETAQTAQDLGREVHGLREQLAAEKQRADAAWGHADGTRALREERDAAITRAETTERDLDTMHDQVQRIGAECRAALDRAEAAELVASRQRHRAQMAEAECDSLRRDLHAERTRTAAILLGAEEAVRDAVAAEREACAQIADEYYHSDRAALAIRDRSEP